MLIAVTLYFWGDQLDLSEITSTLGLNPTTAKRKGDKSLTPTKKEVVAKIGVWGFSSDSEIKSNWLSDHIQYLGSRIGENRDKFRSIKGVQDACVDVFMSGDAREDGGSTSEFELSQQDLDVLRSMNLPVRFTVAASMEDPLQRN